MQQDVVEPKDFASEEFIIQKFMCVKIRRFEHDKCMCRAVKLFPNSMLSVDVTNTLEVQCSKVTLFITQSLTQHFTDTAPILVLY